MDGEMHGDEPGGPPSETSLRRTSIDGYAVLGLVLAILSWLLLPGLAAIGALFAVSRSRKRAGDSPTRSSRIVTAFARVMAIANLVLVAAYAFYIFVIMSVS